MSARDDDPDGRYLIEYRAPHPCLRPEFVRTQRTRVKGKHNMETTRGTLRESGYSVIRVVRTNWFS